jgi:hypothetical protein
MPDLLMRNALMIDGSKAAGSVDLERRPGTLPRDFAA